MFRAGATTTTSVNYELVPSGEHPATEDEDYIDKTNGSVVFSATPTSPPPPNINGDPWARLSWIKIGIERDGVGEEPETFDIVLTNPNNPTGATSTTFTIEDSDGCSDGGPPPCPVFHPKGKLHHPKLHYKYPRNYPYLNEIHLFTQNAKGLGYEHPDYDDWQVTVAELAIRKQYTSGKCAWWMGNGFKPGGCTTKRWFTMTKPPRGGEDYFLYRVKKGLPVSVGKSRVKDYKVWSRWFDRQDNESTLRTGANQNLFEVIAGTKACRTNPFGRNCKPIRPKR